MASVGNEPFMVVAFTEHYDELSPLPEWPQHTTIVPWMQGRRFQAMNRIRDVGAAFDDIAVEITGEDQFGPNGEVKVWTLAENAALHGLHEAVIQAAKKAGSVIQDEMYTGPNYHPHISQKIGQPARAIGDRLILSEISIIGKHDIGKIVFANIPLGHHETAA